jgi:hypothetical protein
MSQQATKNKLCSRCKKYHKYIFEVWNNEIGKKELVCKNCLADLIGLTDNNLINFINWHLEDLIYIYKKYKPQEELRRKFGEDW